MAWRNLRSFVRVTVMTGDEWGPALGDDFDRKEVKQIKTTASTNLVYYFRDKVTSKSMSLNSPVNGPALMKAFKSLRQKGITGDEIKSMIDQFAHDIEQTPLPSHLQPWRAFIAKMDTLYKSIKGSLTDTDYTVYGVDPRLKKDRND